MFPTRGALFYLILNKPRSFIIQKFGGLTRLIILSLTADKFKSYQFNQINFQCIFTILTFLNAVFQDKHFITDLDIF